MTHDEITRAIEKLSSEIKLLSYSSSREAREKIVLLQQQRRELRAQLEQEA